MQLRLWTAATIFIGSYLPLSLILMAQDYNYSYLDNDLCIQFWSARAQCVLPFKNPKLSVPIFLLCIFCFSITLYVLRIIRTKHVIVIKSHKYIPSELMNYTLPYVVSFMSVGYDEQGKFVGIFIFLIWIFWITHKSGQIILNPVLAAFGWKLYDIAYCFSGDDKEYNTIALVKGELGDGEAARQTLIQEVMIVRQE